ncbi:MAG: hypothetical protein ABSF43_14845 [Rectinemataceae bacterium]|jgi:hypothetical protein
MGTELQARRFEYLGRKSTLLANGKIRAVVDALGGMMPEFSLDRGKGGINAHWLPDFRNSTGEPYSEVEHARYWKGKVLYLIAGDFPCSPNFGGDGVVDGASLPAHGWTANEEWKIEEVGTKPEAGAAYARFSLRSPAATIPLAWSKCDLVLEGQNAYYSVMRIRNEGKNPIAVNLARHNTIGAPFLQAGCRISLSADRFMTAPSGTEFDDTGRLAQGAEFGGLGEAPLRDGGVADLGFVPGIIGATDFVTGAVPAGLSLGWSCVVNPALGLAYVCFFPGEAALPQGEIALSFNDLWLQYGGRSFTPWALDEGGSDHSFCLGTENAVAAFANGLAYARSHPELLGRPTTLSVPAGGERKLCYGTALIELDPDLLREGIRSIEAEQGALVLKGGKAFQRFAMDAGFQKVRRFESGLGA